jgi:hypothetical protein
MKTLKYVLFLIPANLLAWWGGPGWGGWGGWPWNGWGGPWG